MQDQVHSCFSFSLLTKSSRNSSETEVKYTLFSLRNQVWFTNPLQKIKILLEEVKYDSIFKKHINRSQNRKQPIVYVLYDT